MVHKSLKYYSLLPTPLRAKFIRSIVEGSASNSRGEKFQSEWNARRRLLNRV